MKRGMLITFEGQDGSGKSTILRLVSEKLGKEITPVLPVPEFSSNILGNFFRRILKKNKFLRLNETKPSALTETMYIIADLYSQDEMEIRPAINQGKIVLKERHIDSILACQIPKIMEDYNSSNSRRLYFWLKQISSHLSRPDLIFFLCVKDCELKKRIRGRGESASKNDFIVFRKRQKIYDCLAVEKRGRWINLLNNKDPYSLAEIVVEHIRYYQRTNRKLTKGEKDYDA